MSKFTRDQIIQERRCGLKAVDEAVANIGWDKLLEKSCKYAVEDPGVWGPSDSWKQFDWAFGNAARENSNRKGEVSMTFNLDEALTPEQMQIVATKLKISETYEGVWKRRIKKA